jgi:uncharacterized protein YjbI with pentapeptide repeats
MAKEIHLVELRKGVESWNRWRQDNPGTQPDLSGANLSGNRLIDGYPGDLDLNESHHVQREINRRSISRGTLPYSDLAGVNLSGADLRATKLNDRFLGGADLSRANLQDADLSRAYVSGANLISANLPGANLGDADLTKSDLSSADLSRANLRYAFLSYANLSNANLSNTSLIGSYLIGANLRGTKLSGAEITNAQISGTIFGGQDLSGVKGLETVIHTGPSSIAIDSFYLSSNALPEAFLRGAGIPDDLIDYMRSRSLQAIEFYSCFISFSSKNQSVAERLHPTSKRRGSVAGSRLRI